MKNILSRFGKISLLLALMYFVVGCMMIRKMWLPVFM